MPSGWALRASSGGGSPRRSTRPTRFFAKDARFGEDERAAFGIIWQEDLFAEGDEDNRFAVDGEAFMSAQRAWLDAHMPKNGVLLDVDEYGREKLPPKAQPTWTKPKKGDKIGFTVSGAILAGSD
jgi:ParB family chromosome partitioning protein